MGRHTITQNDPCNQLFEVCLLRHPAVHVPPGTCYGRLDVPLVPGWESWAAAMAGSLAAKAPERIWTSPSSRCAKVADILGRQLNLRPTPDNRLRELDFGRWEGTAWDMVPRDALDRWAADPAGFRPPGGESGSLLVQRVAGFAGMLTAKAQSCIVVSHGGPLRLLPALLRGRTADLLAPSPEPGGLSILRLGTGRGEA